jgi:hypothetical protein
LCFIQVYAKGLRCLEFDSEGAYLDVAGTGLREASDAEGVQAITHAVTLSNTLCRVQVQESMGNRDAMPVDVQS